MKNLVALLAYSMPNDDFCTAAIILRTLLGKESHQALHLGPKRTTTIGERVGGGVQ